MISQLLHVYFYMAVIRQILEYAASVWYHLGYLLNPSRPIRLKLFRKDLSASLGLYRHLRHALYQYSVPCWTHEPQRMQRTWLAKFFLTTAELTSLTPSSPRFCTSFTLKSSFEISAYFLTQLESINPLYPMLS